MVSVTFDVHYSLFTINILNLIRIKVLVNCRSIAVTIEGCNKCLSDRRKTLQLLFLVSCNIFL